MSKTKVPAIESAVKALFTGSVTVQPVDADGKAMEGKAFIAPQFNPETFLPVGGHDWKKALQNALGEKGYEKFKEFARSKDGLSKKEMYNEVFGPKSEFFKESNALAVKLAGDSPVELSPRENDLTILLTTALTNTLGAAQNAPWSDRISMIEEAFLTEDGATEETPATEEAAAEEPETPATEDATAAEEDAEVPTEKVTASAEQPIDEAVQQAATEVAEQATTTPDGGAILPSEQLRAYLEAMAARSQATIEVNDQVMQAMKKTNDIQQDLLKALEKNSEVIRLDKVSWDQLQTILTPELPAATEQQ